MWAIHGKNLEEDKIIAKVLDLKRREVKKLERGLSNKV